MEAEYRSIRRRERARPLEWSIEILEKGEYGFLATVGADGLPHVIPISYAIMDQHIYFHCAHIGRKIDNISHQNRVSFVVVGTTQPVYEDGNFSTNYESVNVQGRAEPVTDAAEKTDALQALADKYLPAHRHEAPASIEKNWKRTAVYRISMDHVTGKQRSPAAKRD